MQYEQQTLTPSRTKHFQLTFLKCRGSLSRQLY